MTLQLHIVSKTPEKLVVESRSPAKDYAGLLIFVFLGFVLYHEFVTNPGVTLRFGESAGSASIVMLLCTIFFILMVLYKVGKWQAIEINSKTKAVVLREGFYSTSKSKTFKSNDINCILRTKENPLAKTGKKLDGNFYSIVLNNGEKHIIAAVNITTTLLSKKDDSDTPQIAKKMAETMGVSLKLD